MSSFRIAAVVILAFAGVAGSLGYVSFVSDPALTPIRILFVGNTQDPNCAAMLNGALAAAGEFQAELELCDLAGRQASDDWSDRLAAKYDGVVLASPLAGAVESSPAADTRLRVVSIGERPGGLAPHVYVELNPHQFAHAIAKLLLECMPIGGRVGVLVGSVQHEELADRVTALRKVMEQSTRASSRRYVLVECPVDAPAAASIMESLANAGTVDCVVDLTGEPAVELIEAIQSVSSRRPVPRLVTTDQSESALAAVEAGTIYGIVGHDYHGYGYYAAARLASLCRTNEFGLPVVGHGRFSVQPICLRKHDASEHRRLSRTTRMAPAA